MAMAAYKVNNEKIQKEMDPIMKRLAELDKIEKDDELWKEFINLTQKLNELRKKLR